MSYDRSIMVHACSLGVVGTAIYIYIYTATYPCLRTFSMLGQGGHQVSANLSVGVYELIHDGHLFSAPLFP